MRSLNLLTKFSLKPTTAGKLTVVMILASMLPLPVNAATHFNVAAQPHIYGSKL